MQTKDLLTHLPHRQLVAAILSALLVSCGGGGGGGTGTDAGNPPVADGGSGDSGGGSDSGGGTDSGGGGTDSGNGSDSGGTGDSGNSGGGTDTGNEESQADGEAQNWSDPKTWGGTLPPAGAAVVIPAGKTVVLDTVTKDLGDVRVEGTLKFSDARDVALTATSVTVTGSVQAGSAAAPYTHHATLTLTGQPAGENDGVSRGLRVIGGKLLLYAATPQPVWTKLNQNADAGAKQLTLKETTNWKAGDQIVVAPTDHYGISESQSLTLASASGSTVTATGGLSKSRWGRMQYPTNSGMSLSQDANYKPQATPAPMSLDERAAVGNLSRRIVIEGADDSAWRSTGFGAHVMVMGLKSQVQIDGVEFRRVGQAGALARYPFHWHMLSYNVDTGAYLGDPQNHFLRNSAIWNSANRCVVIHATNGVTVQNNICYDIKGHAFFLEDAVERRNVLDGNLALKTRSPASENLLKIHEGPDVFQGGPSGFWITNPDNTVTNNLAGDSQGNGIWLSFPLKPLGLSRKVNLWPRYTPLKQVENNTVHTSRGPGIMLEWVPVDDEVEHPEQTLGTIASQRYVPMKDGKACLDGNGQPYDYCPDGMLRLTLKRITSFKNNDGAYRNRVTNPDYLEWAVADNVGLAFGGAALDGTIQRGLMVGTSLNHSANKYPAGASLPAGIATYHSLVGLLNNTFFSFPFVDGATSGSFSAEDYYTSAVERGKARNTNNRLIASDAGFRNLQPGLRQNHLPSENWALASALWDTEGFWGPKGWYTVPDTPFLTIGANCVDAKPAGRNGKTCEGEFYGIESIQTDFDSSRFQFSAAINASRQDSNGNEIASWRVENGYSHYVNNDVNRRYSCDQDITPPPGNFCSWELGWMRHFAVRPDSRYVMSFPGWAAPKWLALNISNAADSSDNFLMAVKFDGRLPAQVYTVAGGQWDREQGTWDASYRARSNVRSMTAASSLAGVQAGNGDKFWQDKANNLVWFKHVGNIAYPGLDQMKKNSDEDLYRMYSTVVYPKDTCNGAGNLDDCLARIKNLGLQ